VNDDDTVVVAPLFVTLCNVSASVCRYLPSKSVVKSGNVPVLPKVNTPSPVLKLTEST